jgi:hypothetical protein
MRSSRSFNLLIVGYLTIQVLYPIRGLIQDKFHTHGAFTWNMYSQTYDCRVHYTLNSPAQRQELDYQQYFASRDKIVRVFNRSDLPIFHRFLCEQLRRQGIRGQLMAEVDCRKNKVEIESLVISGANICTAPNYAVTLE